MNNEMNANVNNIVEVNADDIEGQNDLQIAILATSGLSSAFEEIYKRHREFVYSICLRSLKNETKAEDLTQDVFVQIQSRIGGFRGDTAFTTWLHRLTLNQVMVHFRKPSVKAERLIVSSN